MQKLHRQLAEATVRLHGEGYEAVAMWLHSYAVLFRWSLWDAAAPAVVAAREMMFRERGWMTEMSAMEMPCGRVMKMSPRASGRMAEPSAEEPAPAARPGSPRRGGSRVEVLSPCSQHGAKSLSGCHGAK
jgi:hypothetical protein